MSTAATSIVIPFPFGRRLLQLYIVSFPFLSALSPAVWLPVPTAVALVAALSYASDVRFSSYVYFERDDLLLAFAYALGILAIFTRYSYAGLQNVIYSLWLASTYVVLLVWGRGWLRLAAITPKQVGAAAMIGLLIGSTAVIIEFITKNLFDFYLADVIRYSSDQLPAANVLGVLWRPRGLAAEPGFTAMVLETLAPLSWLYLRDKPIVSVTCAAIVIPGLLLCFSAASWICLLTAGLVVMAIRGHVGQWAFIAGGAVILLLVVMSIDSDVQWVFDQIIGRKILDLAGSGDTDIDTIAGRYTTYQAALAVLRNYPFGIGWGMISQQFHIGSHLPNVPTVNSTGMLSLYLEILVSAGLPGVIAFLAFILRKVRRVALKRDPDVTPVLFALVAVALHHAVVLEFWYPMLWFLIGFGDYLSDARPIEIDQQSDVPL